MSVPFRGIGHGPAGALADRLGMAWSIGAIALLTFASGLLVVVRMPETLRSH